MKCQLQFGFSCMSEGLKGVLVAQFIIRHGIEAFHDDVIIHTLPEVQLTPDWRFEHQVTCRDRL